MEILFCRQIKSAVRVVESFKCDEASVNGVRSMLSVYQPIYQFGGLSGESVSSSCKPLPKLRYLCSKKIYVYAHIFTFAILMLCLPRYPPVTTKVLPLARIWLIHPFGMSRQTPLRLQLPCPDRFAGDFRNGDNPGR